LIGIAVVSSERSTGQKQFKYKSGSKDISDNSGKDSMNLLSNRNSFVGKKAHELAT